MRYFDLILSLTFTLITPHAKILVTHDAIEPTRCDKLHLHCNSFIHLDKTIAKRYRPVLNNWRTPEKFIIILRIICTAAHNHPPPPHPPHHFPPALDVAVERHRWAHDNSDTIPFARARQN
jgi:hypothetical protein